MMLSPYKLMAIIAYGFSMLYKVPFVLANLTLWTLDKVIFSICTAKSEAP